jgi:hypothetical protein
MPASRTRYNEDPSRCGGGAMNLLSLIVVFLAIAICVAIAYIAWELSSDEPDASEQEGGAPDDPKKR